MSYLLDYDLSVFLGANVKMNNNKACGPDGILPELLKYSSSELITHLTDLYNKIMYEEKVPEEWRHGEIVRLPKKGNLSDCNNWRGITLLSIPGKVYGSIILERLKKAIDPTLREEQAGFRPGRPSSEQILASSEYNRTINRISETTTHQLHRL